MKTKQVILRSALLIAYLLVAPSGRTQCTFTSGSTGADGEFNPTNKMFFGTGWSLSNNVVTVTNKANGVFNFTAVTISNAWTVKFAKNNLNTPVYLLATSNVTINGTIDLAGQGPPVSPPVTGGRGGPGGFDGGMAEAGGPHGFGPGGGGYGGGGNAGHATAALCCTGMGYRAGVAYGVLDNQPLIGGSGGGGKGNQPGCGGGGAILIASSGTISISGAILASGGTENTGKGSGGAIRIIANTIEGEGRIDAKGGDSNTGDGFIRFEGCANKRMSLSAPPATFGPPGVVFLATNPTIRVASIAGTNTPAIPTGSLTMPDVTLATNFVNPAVIKVTASNVTVGTTFQVIVTPAYGTNLWATNSLNGAYAFSSNAVTMSVYTDRVWRVNALIDYIQRP